MGTLIVILGVAVVFIVVVSGALHHKERNLWVLSSQWEPLAGRLGGTLEGRIPRIRFQLRGRRALVQRDRSEDEPRTRTVVRVDVLGLSRGALKLFPDDFPKVFKRLSRMQDLEIGDPAFDRDYVVQATPAGLAQQVFAPDRRARVIGLLRRLERLGAPRVDLSLTQLEVLVWSPLSRLPDLQALVQVASDLVELLLETSPSGSITLLTLERNPGALCPVCGTALEAQVVDCAKCSTPHHEECWRYAGQCSTYACQEKAFLKDGHRVLPRELRQTPDEWLRDEEARDRRQTGGFHSRMDTIHEADEALRRFERRQRERGR